MVNDAVMMHKCLNGLLPSYLSNKVCTRSFIHNRQTRHRGSCNILSCRIAAGQHAGQHAFYYCGVKIRNNLNGDLKEITDNLA